MIGDIIRGNLLTDNTDKTAAEIVALNTTVPGLNTSNVPLHSYLSLKTLLLGAGATDQDFADCISAHYGLANSIDKFGIDIAVASFEDWKAETSEMLAAVGAEGAVIQILVKTKKSLDSSDENRVEQAHLRIRSLLDVLVREKTNRLPTTLDATVDTELTTREDIFPFHCRWVRFTGVESSVERVSLYTATYIRTFLKWQ